MRITGINVYRVELPLHEGSYKWSGGRSVDVFDSTVVELQTDAGITGWGEVYRLPLEIGLTIDDTQKIEMIELTQKQQRFEIAVDKEPATVALDPNTWVLTETRFGKR